MTDAPPGSLEYQPYVELTASASQPRPGGGPAMRRAGLVIGEWSLDGAAIYGPSDDGHATINGRYETLGTQ